MIYIDNNEQAIAFFFEDRKIRFGIVLFTDIYIKIQIKSNTFEQFWYKKIYKTLYSYKSVWFFSKNKSIKMLGTIINRVHA